MLLRPAKEVLYYIKVSDCERYIWEREKLLIECITMEVIFREDANVIVDVKELNKLFDLPKKFKFITVSILDNKIIFKFISDDKIQEYE